MVATTDQKARLLDLVTGVLELTRDGKRPVEDVSAVLQVIKDDADFVARLFNGSKATTPTLRHKLIPQGWTLVEDVKREVVPIEELELFAFLKDGESWISGKEMRRRAKEAEADFGLDEAEYLLENQGKTPEEYRPFYLVLPGAVLRTPGGNLVVPYFHWNGDRWKLCFSRLEDGWSFDGRLLRRK